MITGDQPRTAAAVARELGLHHAQVMAGGDIDACDDADLARRIVDVDVFARVAPEHKLRIVRALQADGEIVAVTGGRRQRRPRVASSRRRHRHGTRRH